MALNQKGQAAINDALFLLIIVVGISALLYLFSSNYGFSTSEYLSNHYESDFTTSAIKTVLYTSVPHLANGDVQNTKEIDYLVTTIKQSYSAQNPPGGQTRSLDDETFYRLRDRIRQVMKPLDSSKDYVFYILEVDQVRSLLFLYGYFTDFSGTPICAGVGPRDSLTSDVLSQARRVEYFCTVDTERGPESVSTISRFAQGYAESKTGTYFGRLDSPTDTQAIPGEVFLSMWTSSCLTANPDLFMFDSTGLFTPTSSSDRYFISKTLNDPQIKQRIQSYAQNNPDSSSARPIYCIRVDQFPARIAPVQ